MSSQRYLQRMLVREWVTERLGLGCGGRPSPLIPYLIIVISVGAIPKGAVTRLIDTYMYNDAEKKARRTVKGRPSQSAFLACVAYRMPCA